MVTEHQRYVRDERSKMDRKQTRLGANGKLKMSNTQTVTQQHEIDYAQQVMCPFCLHIDKLQAFLISAKQGVSHHKAQCPECKTVMMMKSLTAEWTPEQYAEWVAPYASSGFWQKCKFSVWKERLHKIGWSHRFWTRYKELRGSDETESYTDYIERKSIEDQQEYEARQHENGS